MPTIIGLTDRNGEKIMVNADHIVSYHHDKDARGAYTKIGVSTGFGYIVVTESMYEINDRIDAHGEDFSA